MAEEWIVQREESQSPPADVATLQESATAASIRSADPVRGEWPAATTTPESAIDVLPAAAIAVTANVIVVMTEGRTLGDKMAGTTVVKRS